MPWRVICIEDYTTWSIRNTKDPHDLGYVAFLTEAGGSYQTVIAKVGEDVSELPSDMFSFESEVYSVHFWAVDPIEFTQSILDDFLQVACYGFAAGTGL